LAPFALRFEDVESPDEHGATDPRRGLRVLHLHPGQVRKAGAPAKDFAAALETARDGLRAHAGVAGNEALAKKLGVPIEDIRAAVNQLLADQPLRWKGRWFEENVAGGLYDMRARCGTRR
jgi:hypothetical protein